MVGVGLAEGRILSREEKLNPKIGVKMAENIWSVYGAAGMSVGFNSPDYNVNIDISQGRDSQFSTLAGMYLGDRTNNMLKNLGYSGIPPQLVNLMPKFVNLIHGKLMSMEYDIGVDCIDQTSLNEKEQVKQMLTAWLKLKDSAANYGVVFDKIKEESGMAELPDTTEDVEIMMTTMYKHYDAMKGELELKKVHNVNDWNAIKSKFIMELLQQGIAGVRNFVDGYGVLREEWFPMNRFISSYSETENFDKLTFAGLVDFLTPEQFYCEAKDSMSEADILRVIKEYGTASRKELEGFNYSYSQNLSSKQNYIRVLRFQKLEEDIDNRVFLFDEYGNEYMKKMKANFQISNEEKPLYESKQKTHARTSTPTVYGGSWVVGSEFVYDYGIMKEGQDVSLDYHVFAPGMRNGKVTSVVSQIKEPVYMFSVAWSRLKHVVGQGWNGTIDLNVDMMYKMSLGKGGKNLEAKDVLDLFIMQGISLSSGKQNPNDQNIGRAIQIINEGLTATDFVSVMNLSIETIRNIIGVNELSDASTPKAGTLNGVMEMANTSSGYAIAHYARAYHSVYRRVSISHLGYWKNIPSNDAWTRDYIIGLEAATTEQEWAAYNQDLAKLVTVPLIEGGITTADKFELQYPNMKNLKQGEFMAKIRIRRNMAQARADAEKLQQVQFEGNSRNIQETLAADKEREIFGLDIFKEKEAFLTGEIIKRQSNLIQGNIAVKDLEMSGRAQVADIQGKDSIIRQTQIAHSDQTIQQMKNQFDALYAQFEAIQHAQKLDVESEKIDAQKQAASQKKAA